MSGSSRAEEPAILLEEGASLLGVPLDGKARAGFASYLRLLQAWGLKMNLVSRLDPREIVTAHFLDSLAGLKVLGRSPEGPLLDIGSGAGFPSLPLKIALPELSVTLVESSGKKASFCEEVIRQLGLAGARVLRARAEGLADDPAHAHRYPWIVSRAVGPAASLLDLALPLLAPGGRVLLYKGPIGGEELRKLATAASSCGAAFEVISVSVPLLGRERNLVLISCR